MENMTVFILGIAILSAGTYLMRLGGAKLGNRLALSERSQALLSDAATVLLFSVALATTFYEGEHFAGMARVLGVAFAVFLAWRKMPLIVVIVAAAVVTALLRVAGINAGYGGHAVLRGMDFTLRAGECAALLGPNGSGKTTLLRAISGVLALSAGSVELLGRPLASLKPRERT